MPNRRKQKRLITPENDIIHNGHGELKTPVKAAVRAIAYISQNTDIQIPKKTIQNTLNVSLRSQSRILSDNNSRRLSHHDDEGPNPRGRPRILSVAMTGKISDFLDTCTYDESTLPWHDILELAGTGLTEKDVSEETIRKSIRRDWDIGCYSSAILREIIQSHRDARVEWCVLYIKQERDFWIRVIWRDEIHFRIGL
jgi:hypothetical protein